MYNCIFPEKDIRSIDQYRLTHSSAAIRRRMHILYYKYLGYPHHEITRLSGTCANTVTATIRRYQEGGLQEVMRHTPYRPESELQQYRDLLLKEFNDRPPATLKEAAATIERLTGIKRSPSSVRTFLRSLGMGRRKVGAVPGKADLDEQEAFINNKLEPRLDEAKAGIRQVYFVDAAHFVLAPFLGFLWSISRIFIKSPAGRWRFNVLGALNAITHDIVTVTNST
jgi:transposase